MDPPENTTTQPQDSDFIPPDTQSDIEVHALLSDNDSATPLWNPNGRRRREASPFLLAIFIVFPAFFGIVYYNIHKATPQETAAAKSQTYTKTVAQTILISIDGFRNEYLSRQRKNSKGVNEYIAPNLRKLAKTGVYAKNGMQPAMPTKTFPNHWSIVTGLYPEYHGIIGNTMYDPLTKKWFHHSENDSNWYHGEPIWKTLSRTKRILNDPRGRFMFGNGTYSTGTVFWPGSTVDKHRPDAYWVFDASISYEKRIDRGISLLTGTAHDLGEEVDFLTLYFDHVDEMGHRYGPDSQQVEDSIIEVDNSIATLLKRLDKLKPKQFNLVIVSDHGMTGVSQDRVINLTRSIPEGTVQDIRITPVGLFKNITVSAEDVYTEVKTGLKNHKKHATVYRKRDIPERWHLRQSRLIPEVVVVAKLGWTITYPHQHIVPGTEESVVRGLLSKNEPGFNQDIDHKGNHGFDNAEEDMQAIFIANGPAFRRNAEIDRFVNIDIYPLLCHIFSAKPAPNNGTLRPSVGHVLQ